MFKTSGSNNDVSLEAGQTVTVICLAGMNLSMEYSNIGLSVCKCALVNFFTGLSYGCSSCRPGSVQVVSHHQALSGPLLSGTPLHHLSLCPHLLIHILTNWLTLSMNFSLIKILTKCQISLTACTSSNPLLLLKICCQDLLMRRSETFMMKIYFCMSTCRSFSIRCNIYGKRVLSESRNIIY